MPPAIREACEKLHKISRDVRILGRLHSKRLKLVSSAVRIMTSSQTARPFQIYQSFLFDVLGAAGSAGPAMVVLCSASLGKDKIVQFNAESRTALIELRSSKSVGPHLAPLVFREDLAQQDDVRV